MRRAIWILLGSVTLVAILFVFVLPARTLLAQRRSLSVTQSQIQVLSEENAKLSQRVAQLQDTQVIEQIAREQYGLVMPGERAYVILPPKTPTAGTGAQVAAKAVPAHHGFWRRLEFWR